VTNLTRLLTPFEYKEAWRWYVRKFKVTLTDTSAYLYNQDDKLLTASPYLLKFDNLDMTEFQVQCVNALTSPLKISFSDIKREVAKRYKIKYELWKLYHVPIENPDFYKKFLQLIKTRSEVNLLISTQPNWNGMFYAEITKAGWTVKKHPIQFLNNNPLELCLDLFTCVESYVGRDEMPYTLSQAWYIDYRIYGDRKFPNAIARHNVEQSYYEYPFKELRRIFRDSDRTVYKDALTVFQRLGKENKYYIMQTIISDKHFEINEDGFLVYYPTRQEALELL